MVLLGEGHLRAAVEKFVGHYHEERRHQSLGKEIIAAEATRLGTGTMTVGSFATERPRSRVNRRCRTGRGVDLTIRLCAAGDAEGASRVVDRVLRHNRDFRVARQLLDQSADGPRCGP